MNGSLYKKCLIHPFHITYSISVLNFVVLVISYYCYYHHHQQQLTGSANNYLKQQTLMTDFKRRATCHQSALL